MQKLTKRDLKFFVLGVLAMFIFETIYNWNNSVNSFKQGWNDAISEEQVSQ